MTFTIPESNFRPVIIIGGGPCSLAISTRLCTTTSGAEYSDSEHTRFHWLRQRHGLASSNATFAPSEILILDKLGDSFMCQWRSQFSSLGIKHLRSPMFFHPDPSDIDALHAFAYREGREDELMEIEGVVGRDPSKHQKKGRRGSTVEVDRRSWTDYYRPGSTLFADFCTAVGEHSGLDGNVRHAEVVDVQYGAVSVVAEDGDIVSSGLGFMIATSKEDVYGCGVCISAIGPSGMVNYPLKQELDYQFPRGSCHSSHLFSNKVSFPPLRLTDAIANKKRTEIVIVGGGLSSAQLAEQAIHKGISKVHFVTRGEIKVQHFDFGLEWVSKNKNYVKTQYWQQESDEERYKAAITARRGGSVNPQYLAVLQRLEKTGNVVIHRHTEVEDQIWDDAMENWSTITLKNKRAGTSHTLDNVDYIFYCTGSTPNINSEQPFQNLLKQNPIKTVGGMPCLTDDLQWSEHVPLFVLGRYAMLRIGPSSANLDGGRLGAERVGWKVQQMREDDSVLGSVVVKEKKKERKTSTGYEELLRCTGGRCNWFGVLVDEEVAT